MSSISSVVAGAGAAVLTNGSGAVTTEKPGQSVEPSGSASASVSFPYYTSPRIYVDPQYGEVVYDYRDPDTGTSTSQIPSKKQLNAYQALQTLSATPASNAGASSSPATGGGTAAPSTPAGTAQPAPVAAASPSPSAPAAAPALGHSTLA
jgi:nucleoid-associated protein YgaU